MSKLKLKIKSAQRESLASSQVSTPGEFYLRLTKPISGRWSLKQVFICGDFPNIDASNNTVPFFENGVDKIATLPIGYYSNMQIAGALQTALNTASGGYNTYTCSLSAITQKLTISTAANPFQLRFGTVPGKTAAVLGFPSIDTALGLSVTSPSIVKPNTVLSFNIKLDGVSSNIIDAKGQGSTFDIPMNANVDPMQWVQYEPSESYRQWVNFDQPQGILHIKVCDDNGNVLDLQQNWTMILESCVC